MNLITGIISGDGLKNTIINHSASNINIMDIMMPTNTYMTNAVLTNLLIIVWSLWALYSAMNLVSAGDMPKSDSPTYPIKLITSAHMPYPFTPI